MSDSITDLTALELSKAIKDKKISCKETMQDYLKRIHKLNPIFNTIVNLADDNFLLKQAENYDQELSKGNYFGWLHGIPQAIKDTADCIGFPATIGSPLLINRMPTQDSIFVSRMKKAGGIIIGKTNCPEFGLGSHTYNKVFGITPNAWNINLTSGGSSGGAAVALAQKMLPVADGSDFMGSLRNPACWNNIFGFRPSQGRIPTGTGSGLDIWINQLATDGPIARNVKDLYELFKTQSGFDSRIPLSLDEKLPKNLNDISLNNLKIGWLGNLNGYLEVENGILEICELALKKMENAGAKIENINLDFSLENVWNSWLMWRNGLVGFKLGQLLKNSSNREKMKPEALWEYDKSLNISLAEFMQASQTRTDFYQYLLKVFENFDILALPVTQVWQFDIKKNWPKEINGKNMDTYHRWMESTLYATFAGLPAISVPGGFDKTKKLPMGIQLIGKPKADVNLLEIALAYENLIPDLLKISPNIN